MMDKGNKICGRCINQCSSESTISLYNEIAQYCIFKCINHYSGCKEVLAYNEAIDHEKTCKKERIKCLYCEFEGNGCQLLHHIKEQHPECTTKDNVFTILLERGLYFVISAKNNYLLYVTLSITDDSINISNYLVMADDNSELKGFKLKFFLPNSCVNNYVTHEIQINASRELYQEQKNSFRLEKRLVGNCRLSGKCLVEVIFLHTNNECVLEQTKSLEESVMANNNQLEQNVTKMELTADPITKRNVVDLKRFAETEQRELGLCVNCRTDLRCREEFYLCHEYHMACGDCASRKCQGCKAFSTWNRVKFGNMSLDCDWEGCGKNINVFDFLLHKQRCTHRQYQCPDNNCRYTGCLEDLKEHWHLSPYKECTEIELKDDFTFYCFMPFCKEFVHVTMELRPSPGFGHVPQVTIIVNENEVVLRRAYDLAIMCKLRNNNTEISPLRVTTDESWNNNSQGKQSSFTADIKAYISKPNLRPNYRHSYFPENEHYFYFHFGKRL